MASKRKKGKGEEVTAHVPEVRRTTSSAVYPAVQVGPPAPEVPEEAPVPAPAPKPPKKGKGAASWALQLALVAVPAAISGLSSYEAGRGDSAAGYKALTTAVKELQDVVKEQAQQQAYLQGELDAMRGEAARFHGTKPVRRPPPPPEMKVSMQLSELPADFSEVVKTKGPLEQKTLVLTAPQDASTDFTPPERLIMEAAEKKRALAIEEMEKKKREESAKKAPAPH